MKPSLTDTIMVEAQNLRRCFGPKEAVKGISFQVQQGEIFGFLGPNGAGKTTTIRMLTGQIEPTSGNAIVAGCDVIQDQALLKERIGVVFEDQNLYERLSARLNLEFSCWLYGLPKQRVDEVLDLVQLRENAKESLKNFSNGMRQRIMIARALLHKPQMLFLDEPSRGLDPISAREIRKTIKQLAATGTTVFLTTHLMEEADQLSNHVAFIVDGRIVANDTPRNLKLVHGQCTLLVTVDDHNHLIDGKSVQQEFTLSLDVPDDQAKLAYWMNQGSVRAIHSREATLEEVFVDIAGVHPALQSMTVRQAC